MTLPDLEPRVNATRKQAFIQPPVENFEQMEPFKKIKAPSRAPHSSSSTENTQSESEASDKDVGLEVGAVWP